MPASFRPELREGVLVLVAEHGPGAYRIDPWPRPRSFVQLGEDGEWLPCAPPVRLIRPLAEEEEWREVRDLIPARVVAALEGVRTMQWDLLVAASHSEFFVDLLDSNPVLAWLWLWRCRGLGFCEEQADHILATQVTEAGRVGQRSLLRWMGLRGTKAEVKFLKKCRVEALDGETAEVIRAILRDRRRLERLRHVPQVGRGLLALACSDRFLAACTPALLVEVARCPGERDEGPTAQRIENHLALLGELGTPLERPFRSLADLHHRHRELVHDFNRLREELSERIEEARRRPPPPVERPRITPEAAAARKERRAASDLPPPPLPGTDQIQPLTTRAQLRSEGARQSNCVAGYWRRVRAGTHYIYRVVAPERCTLSIKKGRDGRWYRVELEISSNRPASLETCELVDRWLEASQGFGLSN